MKSCLSTNAEVYSEASLAVMAFGSRERNFYAYIKFAFCSEQTQGCCLLVSTQKQYHILP